MRATDLLAAWRDRPHSDVLVGEGHLCRVYFEAPRPPSGRGKNARPATPPQGRLCGPITGHWHVSSADLRAEAAGLTAAADLLAALEAGFDPATGAVDLAPAGDQLTLDDVPRAPLDTPDVGEVA